MHSRSGAEWGGHNNLHLLTYLLTYPKYATGSIGTNLAVLELALLAFCSFST